MRRIDYVQLHEGGMLVPDFIPNVGNVLPPPNKALNLKMFDAGDKILLQVTLPGGRVKEGFIPITAVKIARYAPEAPLKPVA